MICARRGLFGGVVCLVALAACQNYPFSAQPDVDEQGVHLRFTVEQPSKVDFLFVVDNSLSMAEEQEGLKTSFKHMLRVLAPKDTRYRIGITSTDVRGLPLDCCGMPIAPADGDAVARGNRGDCQGCSCSGADPTAWCDVDLRRPHDGARGRLIAAFKGGPDGVFEVDAKHADGSPLYDLPAALEPVLAAAFPTGLVSGPAGGGGVRGVPWVIDREFLRWSACGACGCSVCDAALDDPSGCFDDCAAPVAEALVTGAFVSNLSGLGISGWGWEAGVQAALLAVGIDPEASDEAQALHPPGDLTAPGRSNSFPAPGQLQLAPWTRDDALLAVMIISDEEDCSMPSFLAENVASYEINAGQPLGSFCYQASTRNELLSVSRMAELLTAKKGSPRRVVVGTIAGLHADEERTQATARDCVKTEVTATQQPSFDCSCLTGAPLDDAAAWCTYTRDASGQSPTCDAMAGNRYVDFVDQFPRRVVDSVCRAGTDAFGPALKQFAELATRTCFELFDVRPAFKNADFIRVERADRDMVARGDEPQLLPRIESGAEAPAGGAWTYEQARNEICLVGIDRLVGDVYDIFILHRAQF